MKPDRSIRHFAAAAAATLTALAALVGASSVAAAPSTVYSGTLAAPRTDISISLALRGKRLTRATLSNIPVYCSSGGPPVPFTFKATTVSRKGTFSIKGVRRIGVGPLKGQIGEKLTLTGHVRKRAITGRLATVDPRAPTCSGASRFSATK